MPTPTPDEIEARIAAWHAAPGDGTPLHAALGWTHEEYERWVHDPNAAPAARTAGLSARPGRVSGGCWCCRCCDRERGRVSGMGHLRPEGNPTRRARQPEQIESAARLARRPVTVSCIPAPPTPERRLARRTRPYRRDSAHA